MSVYRKALQCLKDKEDIKGKRPINDLDDNDDKEKFEEPTFLSSLKLELKVEDQSKKEVVTYPDRIRKDIAARIGFLKGLLDYREVNGVLPFSDEDSMSCFIFEWLEIGGEPVPADFLLLSEDLWASAELMASDLDSWASLDPMESVALDLSCQIWNIEKNLQDRRVPWAHLREASSSMGKKPKRAGLVELPAKKVGKASHGEASFSTGKKPKHAALVEKALPAKEEGKTCPREEMIGGVEQPRRGDIKEKLREEGEDSSSIDETKVPPIELNKKKRKGPELAVIPSKKTKTSDETVTDKKRKASVGLQPQAMNKQKKKNSVEVPTYEPFPGDSVSAAVSFIMTRMKTPEQAADYLMRFIRFPDPLEVAVHRCSTGSQKAIKTLGKTLNILTDGWITSRQYDQCIEYMFRAAGSGSFTRQKLEAIRTISGIGRPIDSILRILQTLTSSPPTIVLIASVQRDLLDFLNLMREACEVLQH